jgi:signal transduction histidine kinase
LTLGTRPTAGTSLSGAFQPVSADVAIIVLLYTLAARRPRRTSLYGLAACLIGIVIAVIRWPLSHGTESPQHMILVALVIGVPTVSAWVLGNSMAYRRAYYAWLEERARRAEAERDTRARIAVAAERARIAREMHDVIAHHVSVIVVQADGAAYAFDQDPARARQAIGAISHTGRQALAEMRRLLGVLRDGEESADMAPQPGLAQISELLAEARLAGLPASLTVEGEPRPLDGGRELAAYRIVQEALTNTRKHGGLGADAAVLLRYTDDGLLVQATDTGHAHADGDGDGPGPGSTGHGIAGMRERVQLYGGTLRAGSLPGGGYEVTATLPASTEAVAA